MKWVCCADRCMWQTCTYIWLTQSWQTYTCIHLTNPVLANMCIHLTQSWQTCAYIWLTQSWQICTIYVWLTQFWRHDCFLFLHLFKVHTNLFPCAYTVHCMQHVTCFTSDLLVSYKCDRQCALCCVQRIVTVLYCCGDGCAGQIQTHYQHTCPVHPAAKFLCWCTVWHLSCFQFGFRQLSLGSARFLCCVCWLSERGTVSETHYHTKLLVPITSLLLFFWFVCWRVISSMHVLLNAVDIFKIPSMTGWFF